MARVAVVDLGSNSTRLLIADVTDGRVRELARETEITRLGEGVDASSRLSDAAMQRVYDAIGHYSELIERAEVERVAAVATSAVRDSENADEFRAELRDRFALEVRTITGDEEANYTFVGATSAHGDSGTTLVIDIGGGSTEFVVGQAGLQPQFHVSTQAGSVRQTERHLNDDPPSSDQLARLREDVRETIDAGLPTQVRRGVERAIAVAGTATSLAAIDQRLDPYDSAFVDGYELPLSESERILEMLAELPLERRREVVGLNPKRAPTIVAGAAILVEAVRAFELGGTVVSEADLLQGVALRASALPI